MASIKTSSFPTSEYNCSMKKPKCSNISSISSDLHVRSSPENQVWDKLFCGNLDFYTAPLTEVDAFNASRVSQFDLRWPTTVFQYTGVSKHYLKTTYF